MLTLLLLVLTLTQASAPSFTLAAVDARGAKRYTAEEIARLGGLRIGQSITVAEIAATAERLGGSGLFRKLSYQYLPKGRQVTIVFEFEEADWSVPVVFDNFVWFTDDELITAVRQDVPSFDGTIPELASKLIVQPLEKLLKNRQLEGRVQFILRTDEQLQRKSYLFSVTDPAPRFCAFTVDGASAPIERELAMTIQSFVGSDYSRAYVTSVTDGTLRDVYRRRGYWAAAFSRPDVAPHTSPACTGVTVTLTVAEGAPYRWNGALWTGNVAIPGADLDALLGMKMGDIIDGSRLDASLREVRARYRRNGYLLQRTEVSPRLDDAAHTAVFELRVVEGPQFRVGSVEFVGLPDADADALKRRWRLQPGDVYDESYPGTFARDEMGRGRQAAGRLRLASVMSKIDPKAQLVHLSLVFK